MPALDEIPEVEKSSAELLDAAGIRDARHLAQQDPEGLLAKLIDANEVLEIVETTPDEGTVEQWISAASELIGAQPHEEQSDKEAEQPSGPVNYEQTPEVVKILEEAPYAIPLPGKLMMEKKIRVGDIPAGLLLNRYSGDLDIRLEKEPVDSIPEAPTYRHVSSVERIETGTERKLFDPSIAKPMSQLEGKGTRIPVSKSNHEDDRVALIRTPREKTNRGKSPSSRRYIRGVLHTHPLSIMTGAVLTLLLLLNLPLAIVSAFLLLLSQEKPETFDWVPTWIIAFPIALPIIGFGYLIWGFNGKCRICTQKLFVHKAALKHIKAHRLPGLGYVIPLCLHLLLFKWFRCSSCGTPVRLKK